MSAQKPVERPDSIVARGCELKDSGLRNEIAALLASPEGRKVPNFRVLGPCSSESIAPLTLVGDDGKPIATAKPIELSRDNAGAVHAKVSESATPVDGKVGDDRSKKSPEAQPKSPLKADDQGVIRDASGKAIASIGTDGKLRDP